MKAKYSCHSLISPHTNFWKNPICEQNFTSKILLVVGGEEKEPTQASASVIKCIRTKWRSLKMVAMFFFREIWYFTFRKFV